MKRFFSQLEQRMTQLLESISPFMRSVLVILMQAGLVALANGLAFVLRFEASISFEYQTIMVQGLPPLLAVYIVSFWTFSLHKGLWRYVGFHDLKMITSAAIVSSIASYLLLYPILGWLAYPRSVLIMTGLLSVVFLTAVRGVVRLLREWAVGDRSGRVRVLIVGAGSTGEMLARDLVRNSSNEYEPAVFADDDATKCQRTIHGIPVGGTIADIPALIRRFDVKQLVVAIPSASTAVMQRILAGASSCHVPIRIVPSTTQMLEDSVSLRQMRPLSLEDLLQREPIQGDRQELHPLLQGRRIVVTGAGGSIGSELSRQVARYHPETLILFERHEHSLHTLELELRALYPLLNLHAVLGDVTNNSQVQVLLNAVTPDTIFHAAAYKQVPMMERNAAEAIRNNVIGTQVVAQAARKARVARMVLISTDKAVNPSSVMGATKRVAESIMRSLNQQGPTRFTTVRFGNVLGSAGSVIPLFMEQIRKGGPVTVTHPDVRRYFMTIPESVELILQAAVRGDGGDLFVLDMGEQVRVVDLARQIIMLSGLRPGQDIDIAFTGLRPGEKMSEELVEPGEQVHPTSHSKIKRVVGQPVLPADELARRLDEVVDLLAQPDQDLLLTSLKKLVPTFTPVNNGSLRG